MAQNISVPDIGDFKDVEVIEVLVKPGDQIKKNDPLVTIESDKSSVEIPSPSEGQIKDLKVKVGDKVSEGSLLVTLETEDSSNIQVKKEEKKVHKEIKKEKPKKNGNVVTTQSLKQIKKVFNMFIIIVNLCEYIDLLVLKYNIVKKLINSELFI